MRIIIYLTLITLVLFSVSSCSKGERVDEPLFGYLSFYNFASGVSVVGGTDQKILTNGTSVSLASGNNRFRFYNAEALLLDTILKVSPLINQPYFLFKPNSNSSFRILDLSFNGFDKQILPDSGTVKISLANFSTSLPDKVNVYLTTETYGSNGLERIQVGEFLNTSGSFSMFQKVIIGKNQSSRPQNSFELTIKDPKDNRLLNTVSFTLPIITSTGKLINGVYVIYISANNATIGTNNATILMSK